MTSWLFLLPIMALLVGVGTFLDTYHPDTRVADRARTFLISVYLAIETKATIAEALNMIRSSKAVLPGLRFVVLFYALPVALLYSLAEGEAPALLITLMLPIWLTLTAMILIALLFILVMTATGSLWVMRVIAMQMLGKASDPKISPFGYAASFLSLVIAFAKVATDAITYFAQ